MSRVGALIARFGRCQGGANAVEFGLVATPFLFLILFIVQMGIHFITKMSLDAAVMRSAEELQAAFNTGTTPVLPSANQMRTKVVTHSGGMIDDNGSLAVEVQPLGNLKTATVAVSNGVSNYGAPNTVLAIRARYAATSYMPGFPSVLSISSSALVRRSSQ